jgi:chemotaxis protein CheD
MYNHYDRKFDRQVSIIHPGEYFSSDEDIIISTILGSCIAVAMYDSSLQLGGLNHFMLPGELHGREFFREESGRYGMFAMELLINDLIKKGARRDKLAAKVFGGGHVLNTTSSGSIPDSNIRFALDFLRTERIPIASQDVGGTEARKVMFFPRTARVLLKRFGGKYIKPVEREETAYLERIKRKKRDTPDVTLF